MKKYHWINVKNVKKIAHILLQLDEQSLKNLLIQVNAFMSLLTENAQQRIKQQFIHDTDGM